MRRILYITLLLLASCRYADFEPIPPLPTERWDVNWLLDELSQSPTPITGGVTVEGIVVANDSTGNFYKQIIIVDHTQTASLAIGIGYYDSYAQFPVNELVALRLDGLILKQVDGLLTAGYAPLAPDTIPVPISSVALAMRHLHLQGERIDLPEILHRFDELTASDIGLPFLFTGVYMDSPIGTYATERTLCRVERDTTATLYTSPYAAFANDPVPSSVFDLRAIVVSYKNKLQLKMQKVRNN